MYKKVTKSIEVCVSPVFLDEQSDPHDNHFVWSYNVRIENHGKKNIQIKSRNWVITDKSGRTMSVEGEGIIGELPILRAGDSFQYSSGIPLNSPSGIMHGTYFMVADDGGAFEVQIPAFSLDSPYDNSSVH